jgi:hypothetical protein
MYTKSDLHRVGQLKLWLPIAAALLVGSPTLTAQIGLGLSPMRMELRLSPGASYSSTLRLANEGDPVRVRTDVLDFQLDAEQNPQFEPGIAAEVAYSCRSWLTVNPMEAELNVKQGLPVRYTLRVPASAQPQSYNCAVGFTSLPTAAEVTRFGVRTAVRVVTAFYVIVGNPRVEGRLSEIAMEHIPGSKDLRAVVVLENSGKMFYRPTGTLVVLDPTGAVIESYDVTPLPVLPERKQRFLFPLKNVSAGQPCALRVRLDLGTGEIQEGTAVIPAARVRE